MSVRHQVDGVTATADELNSLRNTPCGVQFAITPNGNHAVDVAIVLCDPQDDATRSVVHCDVWLSGADSGAGLHARKPSDFEVLTGRAIHTYESKQHFRCETSEAGTMALRITDTHASDFRVAVECPATGRAAVSRALTSEDYG